MRNYIIRAGMAICVSFVCYMVLYLTPTGYISDTAFFMMCVIGSDFVLYAILRDEDNARRVVEEYNQRVMER